VTRIEFEIRHLFVSTGHNYFGHHGLEPGDSPMTEAGEIHCVAGKGIMGDRFFNYRNGKKGNITFFEEETYQSLCLQLGVRDRGLEVFRRNVITLGVNLNELIGVEFELQCVRFFGDEESRPCYWMNYAFAPGAEDAMKGHGGLRATILSDGVLRQTQSAACIAHKS
jgi:MOSC domain-containing protein YiiM